MSKGMLFAGSLVGGIDYGSIYQEGLSWLADREQNLLALVKEISEIPAPTFAEASRAEHVADLWEKAAAAGGGQVYIDECGNAIYVWREPPPGKPVLLVTAHLDTVFPPGTPIKVKHSHGRLFAPGIQDNSVKVAILVELANLFCRSGLSFQPDHGLVFAANVGEEGLGDLRGMKYIINEGIGKKWPIAAALIFDGDAGLVCYKGTASRRLQVTYKGPGGHSWGDFGKPSAIEGLGRAIAGIYSLSVPREPRTTYNVGVVKGGVSVNSIAAEAEMLIDIRSEDPAALAVMEEKIRNELDLSLHREKAAGAGGTGSGAPQETLQMNVAVVGDRPGGRMPDDHSLVQAVREVAEHHRIKTKMLTASTDANVPLSQGIPAVTVGVTAGGRIHTLEEYLEEDSVLPGAQYALALVLACSRWVVVNG
ncbi:MAG TPA: M20/M25/M40 family metallo-hydrolase [Firmicutes bacterium]|nr:M20/M25/M40 family metallo-hydrolase [Bacillota bacterium]